MQRTRRNCKLPNKTDVRSQRFCWVLEPEPRMAGFCKMRGPDRQKEQFFVRSVGPFSAIFNWGVSRRLEGSEGIFLPLHDPPNEERSSASSSRAGFSFKQPLKFCVRRFSVLAFHSCRRGFTQFRTEPRNPKTSRSGKSFRSVWEEEEKKNWHPSRCLKAASCCLQNKSFSCT